LGGDARGLQALLSVSQLLVLALHTGIMKTAREVASRREEAKRNESKEYETSRY